MVGGRSATPDESDARVVPVGDEGFVVVDDDGLSLPESGGGDTGQDAAPFSPGAFPALGASLSTRVTSTSPTVVSSSSSCTTQPNGSPSTAPNSASGGEQVAAAAATADLVYRTLCAYAVVANKFMHAHVRVVYEFVYVHALVIFEFFYSYAVVAVRETAVERAWSWTKSTWQRWQERGPAPLKRVLKRRCFPVLVAVVLSMIVVFPAYWAMPRGGGGVDGNGGDGPKRLSVREWQAKYDLLSSKHSADAVRHRLKYDNLAGRHLELQAEYESLLKDYKDQQRINRASRSGAKTTPQESCSSKPDTLLGPAREALKLAEQSAYEYLSHFAEGFREDVHEVKGLFQRKTRSWLEALR